MKRHTFSILIFVFAFIVLIGFPSESSANKARGEITDGNATGSSYDPKSVQSSVRQAWERWNANDRKKIIEGGKEPWMTPSNGNHLVFDVYENKGWSISGNTLTFEGWSALIGHYHHDRYNQATYIGLVNVNNEKERKIYKAEMLLNRNAATKARGSNSDIYFEGATNGWCPENRSSLNHRQDYCNMEYKHVGFKAHLPLDELFPSPKENKEWKLYIIKNINGHLVYDQLVLSFSTNSKNWKDGTLSLQSKVDNKRGHSLIPLGSRTLKRLQAGSRETDPRYNKYFRIGNLYRIYSSKMISNSVTPWYELIVPEDNKAKRWTTSAYLRANGVIASLSYERNYYDIGIKHVDQISKEVLLEEKPKSYKRGTRTFNSKPRGHFKTPEGYEYVPMDTSKSVKVDKDKTITFNYKASLPNPSRVVEQGGGKNMHGKATGEAEWKLAKEDKPEKMPDPNSDDFEWRNVTGGVEITKYIGENKNVNIPSKLDGKNVVSIGANAFTNKGLTGVTLPDTVIRINEGAFKSNHLGAINIPDNVTAIGDEAFENNQITQVSLPDHVKTVGARAFLNNNIHGLTIGSSIKTIGELAFASNEIGDFDASNSPNLKYIEKNAFLNNEISSVLLNEGLIHIGENAFLGNNLTNVNVPSSVDVIETYAFASNTIEHAIIPNNHTQINDYVFSDNQENSKDLIIFGHIPSTAKTYADENDHTFRDLYEEYVYIDVTGGVEIVKYNGDDYDLDIPAQLGGKNVVSIGAEAFKDMAITSIKLPSTIHTIGEMAFADNQLNSADLSNVKKIKSGAFTRNKIKNVTFNSQLEELGSFAFRSNELTSVTIPGGITVVEHYVFDENELTSVNLHNNITEIKERAFADNKLKTLNLPSKIKVVGELAFWNNELTNVTLNDSLEKIEARAFDSNNLSEIVIENAELEIGDQAFSGNRENAEEFTIRGVCDSTASEYAEVYGHMFTDLNGKPCCTELPTDDDYEFVKTIGTGTYLNKDGERGYFRYIGDDKEVEIPHTIQCVEITSYYRMFEGEDQKVEKVISDNPNVTNMSYMFSGASSLTELDLSSFDTSNVTHMNRMFSGASSLTELDLSSFDTSNVTDMRYMFYGTSSLTELDLSSFDTSNVTDMRYMFRNASSLTELDLSSFNTSNVTNMDSIFRNASSLTELDLSSFDTSNVTNMSGMFWNARSLTELDLSSFDTSKVMNMGYMFYGTSSLTELDLSSFDTSKVMNMGYMFFGTSSLTGLDLSSFDTSNVTDMRYMFRNASSLTELALSSFDTSKVTNMGYMFYDASSLTELDLSSFDTSNVRDMSFMFFGAINLTKGYARTQADADNLNTSSGKPSGLTFIVKKGAFNNLDIKGNLLAVKDIDLNVSSITSWFKDLFKTTVVHAQEKLDESMTHLINNFVPTGNHRDIRNVKHTIKVGNHTETDTKPFAIVANPEQTKNKDMEYDFEYEYTNHIKRTYKCTDKKGNDCFKWKLDKTEPAWEEPYAKKFRLSDTNGEFERYTTSRLGRIDSENARIYSSLDDNTGEQAGSTRIGNTYYIKEKAVRGNEARYLISTSPSATSGVIGWVNELDMTTYTHYSMDSKTKKFKLTGAGYAFTRPWGGNQQRVADLGNYKGKTFTVNLTNTVGDDIWYRGTFSGVSGNVWVRSSHTTSNEIVQINATDEMKLNNVNNNNAKYTLAMDHKHNDTVIVDKDSNGKIEALVGRERVHTERNVTDDSFGETIEVDRKDTKLKTQSSKEVKNTFTYHSDYGNEFTVIDGDKYYYPNDIDESVRHKYENKTRHNYGKYALPLRVSDEKKDEIEFKLADNFFLTKKTGFMFSLPHDEVSTLVINQTAKEEFEAFTGKEYDDTVISDPFNASKYYMNIDLNAEQKPNTKYDDNVVIGKVGLSDLTVHLLQELEFEHYLFGHYSDDPIVVDQRTSPVKGIEYPYKVKLTKTNIDALREIKAERDGKIHSFKPTDYKEFIEKVKEVAPF